MPLRAVIFDVDGTLAETEETHRQSLNETFAAFGLPWFWDQAAYRRLLRVMGGKERLRHFIEHDRPPMAAQALARLNDIHAAKNARYAAKVRAGAVKLRPGVARLIDEAKDAGLRLAIATTTSLPNVEALLQTTLGVGGPDLFDVIATGDLAPSKKPAPDVFLLALRRLRLTAEQAVAIEDTEQGLASAKAAGLATLVTPSFYSVGQDVSAADAVFDSLGEPGAPARWLSGQGRDATLVSPPLLDAIAAERAPI